MAEERRSQRIEIELPARFTFNKDKGVWFEAIVINISTNGFCFRADAKHNPAFSEKPAICLAIGFSDDEKVELNIQVVWSGKTSSYNCMVGGEIQDPSGKAYQKVLEFYTNLFRAQANREKEGQK